MHVTSSVLFRLSKIPIVIFYSAAKWVHTLTPINSIAAGTFCWFIIRFIVSKSLLNLILLLNSYNGKTFFILVVKLMSLNCKCRKSNVIKQGLKHFANIANKV